VSAFDTHDRSSLKYAKTTRLSCRRSARRCCFPPAAVEACLTTASWIEFSPPAQQAEDAVSRAKSEAEQACMNLHAQAQALQRDLDAAKAECCTATQVTASFCAWRMSVCKLHRNSAQSLALHWCEQRAKELQDAKEAQTAKAEHDATLRKQAEEEAAQGKEQTDLLTAQVCSQTKWTRKSGLSAVMFVCTSHTVTRHAGAQAAGGARQA
jgi:hypothetical protein